MRLSPAAEYAIRGALVLAEHYGQGPVSLGKVCKVRGLSKEYMTKLFSVLARAGLVQSVRGKRGGYVLARDPVEIPLLSLIEVVEGPLVMNFCLFDPPQCHRAPTCPVHPVWVDIQDYAKKRLAAFTLADCLS